MFCEDIYACLHSASAAGTAEEGRQSQETPMDAYMPSWAAKLHPAVDLNGMESVYHHNSGKHGGMSTSVKHH